MRRIARKEGASTDMTRDHEFTDWAGVVRFSEEIAAEVLERTETPATAGLIPVWRGLPDPVNPRPSRQRPTRRRRPRPRPRRPGRASRARSPTTNRPVTLAREAPVPKSAASVAPHESDEALLAGQTGHEKGRQRNGPDDGKGQERGDGVAYRLRLLFGNTLGPAHAFVRSDAEVIADRHRQPVGQQIGGADDEHHAFAERAARDARHDGERGDDPVVRAVDEVAKVVLDRGLGRREARRARIRVVSGSCQWEIQSGVSRQSAASPMARPGDRPASGRRESRVHARAPARG